MPWNYVRNPDFGNYLLEAMPPTSTWGKTFLCRQFAPRDTGEFASYLKLNYPIDTIYDIVRILALNNNTLIKINGVTWTTLAVGAHIDTNITTPIVIETSDPVLVAEYSHAQYLQVMDTFGNAFLSLVPPLEQRDSDITFFCQLKDSLEDFRINYMIIAGNQSLKNDIVFDGSPLPQTGFIDLDTKINGESLTIGSYAITPGIHRIQSRNITNPGMTLLVYGSSNYNAYTNAYGYAAGSLYKPLHLSATANPSEGNVFSAFPNPSFSETTLMFTLNHTSYVTIVVYDELGRLVWGDGKGSSLEAGTHVIHLDGSALPSGTLYARIATGFGEVKTVKLVHEK
jgi:hypothetical protein